MNGLQSFLDAVFPGPKPEPIRALSLVKYAARESLRHGVHVNGRRKAVASAQRGAGKGEGLAVTYGGAIDSEDAIVIGGAVKLLALRDRLPDTPEAFRLIYLVSSALPAHAEAFVKEAKRHGAKLVLNQNGVAYRAWCGDFYPWFNTPMRRLHQWADYVIYQSAFCRANAQKYLGETSAPSEILFNPVDTNTFVPSPTPRPPGSPWRLLAAGTNHHFYRVRAVLDCLRLLRSAGHEVILTIAGEFRWKDGEAEVRNYVRQNNLTSWVRYLPPYHRNEAPRIYQNADILIHPKYKDPCPTVPIEALSSGIPVVGSQSGGMPELVTEACGILLPVPDDWENDHVPRPGAFSRAVETIIQNHASYAQAARQRALAAFCETQWLDRHVEIFRNLLSC